MRVTPVSGFAIPADSLGVVLRHSFPLVIYPGKLELSGHVSLLGTARVSLAASASFLRSIAFCLCTHQRIAAPHITATHAIGVAIFHNDVIALLRDCSGVYCKPSPTLEDRE